MLLLLLLFIVYVFHTPALPSYEETVCPFTLTPTLIEGENVRCGYLTVPEQHNTPDSSTIRLAVLHISVAENPLPDPIMMVIGGPNLTIMNYMNEIGGEVGLELAMLTGRDFIVMDQRGTGYSEPLLSCLPERETSVTNPTIDVSSVCAERLQEEGYALSAYNSSQIAADIDALRETLGYEQINLYGHSYGTFIAQVMLREYPDTIRTALLESVVYPGAVVFGRGIGLTNSLRRVFDDCAADMDCAAAFPTLEADFEALIATLQTGSRRANANDVAFIGLLYEMLEHSSLPSAMPLFIDRFYAQDFDAVQRIYVENVRPPQQSIPIGDAMGKLVSCADSAQYLTREDIAAFEADVRLEFRNWNRLFQRIGYFEDCAKWPYFTFEDAHFEPIESDIPTLILNGTYDQNTPLINARYVAEGLGQHYLFEVPGVGHFPLLYGLGGYDCMRGIYVQFLDDPTSRPDGACIEARTPSFALP